MQSCWLAAHGGGRCSGFVGGIACVSRMFRMPAAAGASLAPHGCYSRSLDARRCSINPTGPARAPGGHVRTCIDVELTEHASGRIAVGQHNTCGLRQRRLRAWRCVCIVWCIGTDGGRGSDGRSYCGRPEERLLCVWRPRWRLSPRGCDACLGPESFECTSRRDDLFLRDGTRTNRSQYELHHQATWHA